MNGWQIMELKDRRLNRLECFDYEEPGCYFITVCTQNRQRIFEIEKSDVGNGLCAVPDVENKGAGKSFSGKPQNLIIHKWLTEMQKKFDSVVVEHYVIMPDHIHLMVRIKERHTGRSLPDVIRFFKTMTTNEYIREVKKGILTPFDKKLWQKSYYDHIIRNQQDYNEAWEYIENNPLKWTLSHGE